MTINYGGITFDGPYRVTEWEPPYRAALYAIIMPDETCKPKPFQVLYFGESGNLSDRGFWRSHHKYQCFIRHAGSESNLFIGIHKMPGSTESQRREVEQRLIKQYKPICNR